MYKERCLSDYLFIKICLNDVYDLSVRLIFILKAVSHLISQDIIVRHVIK